MKRRTWVAFIAIVTLLAAGCGRTNIASNTTNTTGKSTKTSTTTSGQKTMIVGGQQYAGEAKLTSYEKKADAHPKDVNSQIQAGISAHVNQNFQAAIKYYQRAIAADPTSAVSYNNLGNVYLRGLKQPQNALAYYQKATQVDSKYAYGWWNLALCQAALGNKAEAKQTLETPPTKVPISDANYKNLQSALKELG